MSTTPCRGQSTLPMHASAVLVYTKGKPQNPPIVDGISSAAKVKKPRKKSCSVCCNSMKAMFIKAWNGITWICSTLWNGFVYLVRTIFCCGRGSKAKVLAKSAEHLANVTKSTSPEYKFCHLKNLVALRLNNSAIDDDFQKGMEAIKEDDLRIWLERHRDISFQAVKKDPKLADQAISFIYAHYFMNFTVQKFNQDAENNRKIMLNILTVSISGSDDRADFQKDVWRLYHCHLQESDRKGGLQKFLINNASS